MHICILTLHARARSPHTHTLTRLNAVIFSPARSGDADRHFAQSIFNFLAFAYMSHQSLKLHRYLRTHTQTHKRGKRNATYHSCRCAPLLVVYSNFITRAAAGLALKSPPTRRYAILCEPEIQFGRKRPQEMCEIPNGGEIRVGVIFARNCAAGSHPIGYSICVTISIASRARVFV